MITIVPQQISADILLSHPSRDVNFDLRNITQIVRNCEQSHLKLGTYSNSNSIIVSLHCATSRAERYGRRVSLRQEIIVDIPNYDVL